MTPTVAPEPPAATLTLRDLRDPRVQTRLARDLRGATPADACDRLVEMARLDLPCALDVARRVLGGRHAWANFALATLPMITPSVQTADRWLATFYPALGPSRAMALLGEAADALPEHVRWLLYFLPQYLAGNAEAHAAFARLNARLPQRPPLLVASPG